MKSTPNTRYFERQVHREMIYGMEKATRDGMRGAGFHGAAVALGVILVGTAAMALLGEIMQTSR
jgi:hypothetical protein